MLTIYKIPCDTIFPKKLIGNFDTPYTAMRAVGISLDALCRALSLGAAIAAPDCSGRLIVEWAPKFLQKIEEYVEQMELKSGKREARRCVEEEFIRLFRHIAIEEAVRAHVDFLDRKEIAALLGIDQARLRDILYGAREKIRRLPDSGNAFFQAIKSIKQRQRGEGVEYCLRTRVTVEYDD